MSFMRTFPRHVKLSTTKKKTNQKHRGDRVGDWKGQENSSKQNQKIRDFTNIKQIKINKGEK